MSGDDGISDLRRQLAEMTAERDQLLVSMETAALVINGLSPCNVIRDEAMIVAREMAVNNAKWMKYDKARKSGVV